jgi:outer membrane cobalamin receptor
MNSKALLAVFLFLSPILAVSQDTIKNDTLDYYEMSLEQLLNVKSHGIPSELEKLINQLILAASKKPLSSRESPALISIVTQEEIKNSGARDLMDVLHLVPGIFFGVDVEGVVGIGIRGNWAHEGKVLLLLDGQEMNEIMFATTQYGNHFPIDQIKKIEIIRGPGSAIYGGFAEYGVINIITKSGEDLTGMRVAAHYGQFKESLARINYSLSAGSKINKFEWSLAMFMGHANRSDQVFSDFYGGTYEMHNNSNLDPAYLNLGLSWKGLSARFIIDHYVTSSRDGYDIVKDDAYREDFNSVFGELKYKKKINDKFSFTTKINYKQQTPWKTLDVDTLTSDYYKVASRYSGSVFGSWNITPRVNLIGGADVYYDTAEDLVDSSFFYNGEQKVSYLNQGYYLQGLIKTRFVNFIIGSRYDIHSEYGSAFVPRVGLTKKIKKLHFKLLYSNSFRAPSIENINLADSNGIKPEKTTVIELEVGYQFKRNSILTLNFFDITTKDPIVYYYDDSLATDNYHNFGSGGTTGIEAEYRYKEKWGYLTCAYSFYSTANKDKVDDYTVPDHDELLLAFPAHKITINASINLTKKLSINPSVVWFSRRYGYDNIDSTGTSAIHEYAPGLLGNIFLNYNDILKGLTLGVGVYDILDEKIKYIQPYNGYHAPLPGPSREFVFHLSYNIGFKKTEKKK